MAWSRRALADVHGILRYLAERNPVAADHVGAAIFEAGQGLEAFPYKGHRGRGATREWMVPRYPNYLLVYRVTPESITILRVWHQARLR